MDFLKNLFGKKYIPGAVRPDGIPSEAYWNAGFNAWEMGEYNKNGHMVGEWKSWKDPTKKNPLGHLIIRNYYKDNEMLFLKLKQAESVEFLLKNNWLRFLEGRDYEYSTYLNTNFKTGTPQFTIKYFDEDFDIDGVIPFGKAQENAVAIFVEHQDYFFDACTKALIDYFPKWMSLLDDNEHIYKSMENRVVKGFLPNLEDFDYKKVTMDLENIVRLTGPNILKIGNIGYRTTDDVEYMEFQFYNAFDMEYDVCLVFHGKEFIQFHEPGDR